MSGSPTTLLEWEKIVQGFDNLCKMVTQNRQNKDLHDKWLINEGLKYCRMLSLEHSAILLTFIKQ